MNNVCASIGHKCIICGHPIYSDESIQRGYGSECAAAIIKAKYITIFSNDILKSQYYNLDIDFILNLIYTELDKNLRNNFKKNFLLSVKSQIEEKKYITKKQREVLLDMLVYSKGINNAYTNYLQDAKYKMLDSLCVDRELVEKARQIIRSMHVTM